MTMLCGWLPVEPHPDAPRVVAAMGRALRASPTQTWGQWHVGGLALGLLELPCGGEVTARYAPASSADGRHHVWFAGEAFAAGGGLEVPDPDTTRTAGFRSALLELLLKRGADALKDLDGEFHVVWWDAQRRVLTVVNDRFGGLPLYWARSSRGFAFAGGVRGVLMAPGVAADPDPEALREAMTFGGFRLGDRTNVAAVKMLEGAAVMTVAEGVPAFRHHWRWSDIAARTPAPTADLEAEADALWRQAIRRRLSGARSPGQTLSGGLDSRAILAEAAPTAPCWTAITYGIPGCDDARYAERAAAVCGATWVFQPLYAGRDPDWLERRTEQIPHTDGLIQLVDLMHLESLPVQARLLDVHLSGYIGDAVAGPTFAGVKTLDDVLVQLPFYGTPLGLDWQEAGARLRPLLDRLETAPARFGLFEHKLPQSTNRWTAAWRPWLRVRKPFVDHALFDFWQGLPLTLRVDRPLYHRWLVARYPSLFAAIPHQKTGVPVLARPWRLQAARAQRLAGRLVRPTLARLGVPVQPRQRAYFDDEAVWRTPLVRARLEEPVLRAGALGCEILGREQVSRWVSEWMERASGPVQVMGALYVFEVYHRDLAARLRAAATEAS